MYSFTTQSNSDSSNYYGNEIFEDVNYDIFGKIYDFVFNESSTEYEVKIVMPEVYSPYQKLQSDAAPVILIEKKLGATLVLNKQKKGKTTYYNWNIYTNDGNNEDTGLEFITFSDFYSSFTFGMDVITFYVSFVVVVGNIIRVVFLGQSERIMYAEWLIQVNFFLFVKESKFPELKKIFYKKKNCIIY